jgi:hypothetical protein
MPEACERIGRFCQQVAADVPAELLVETLWHNFIAANPLMIAFLGLEDSGVVGHCLVDIESWAGSTEKFATVLQFQLDRPVPRSEMQRCYAQLVRWALSHDATQLQALASNERTARLFRQRYGFATHRILMRRPLIKASPSAPKS